MLPYEAKVDNTRMRRGGSASRTATATLPPVDEHQTEGRQEACYSVMSSTFRVDRNSYSGLKAIGRGAFGVVCSASGETQVRVGYVLAIKLDGDAPDTCPIALSVRHVWVGCLVGAASSMHVYGDTGGGGA